MIESSTLLPLAISLTYLPGILILCPSIAPCFIYSYSISKCPKSKALYPSFPKSYANIEAVGPKAK